MMYHHFLLNLFKIEIFFLLVFGNIIVEMDNFHLFEEVLRFLFHSMGNEIYKQHDFFYIYVCVNVVVHFVI